MPMKTQVISQTATNGVHGAQRRKKVFVKHIKPVKRRSRSSRTSLSPTSSNKENSDDGITESCVKPSPRAAAEAKEQTWEPIFAKNDQQRTAPFLNRNLRGWRAVRSEKPPMAQVVTATKSKSKTFNSFIKRARRIAMVEAGVRPFFNVEFNWLSSWDYNTNEVFQEKSSLAIVTAQIGLYDEQGRMTKHDLGFALVPVSKVIADECKKRFTNRRTLLNTFRSFSCDVEQLENTESVCLFVKCKRYVPKVFVSNTITGRSKRVRVPLNIQENEDTEYAEVLRYGCRFIGTKANGELDFDSDAIHVLLHDPEHYSMKDITWKNDAWMQNKKQVHQIDSLNQNKNEANSFMARMIFSVGDIRVSNDAKISRGVKKVQLPKDVPQTKLAFRPVEANGLVAKNFTKIWGETKGIKCPVSKRTFSTIKQLLFYANHRYPMLKFLQKSGDERVIMVGVDADYESNVPATPLVFFHKPKPKTMRALRQQLDEIEFKTFPDDGTMPFVVPEYIERPHASAAKGFFNVSVPQTNAILGVALMISINTERVANTPLKNFSINEGKLGCYNLLYASAAHKLGLRQCSRSKNERFLFHKMIIESIRSEIVARQLVGVYKLHMVECLSRNLINRSHFHDLIAII